MHTIEEVGTNVAAFLIKLWKIVEDPETNDMITWNAAGSGFYIRNQAQFARDLLPLYFKHNNMASFIRQLNMYGFHKIASAEGGGLKPDKDEMEFAHQCFLMGHPYLLEHIKRKVHKVPTLKNLDASLGGEHPEFMKRVLNDVKGLKGKQESVNSQLTEMKRENEVLWREVAVLRQKHLKQQQIVNKLIQFLVSMVHTSRSGGLGIKRHYPIMLSNIPHSSNKKKKHSVEEMQNLSPGGPVIHELDATDLLEDCTPSSEEVVHNEREYLASEFSVEADTADVPSPAPSTDSMNDLVTAVNTSSPEMLFELAEECSLGPFSESIHGAKQKHVKHKTKKKAKKTSSKNRSQSTVPKADAEVEAEAVPDPELIGDDAVQDVILPSMMNDDAQDGLEMRLTGDEVKDAVSGKGDNAASNKGSDAQSSTANPTPNMTLARTDSSDISRCGLTEDLDLHLDSMDSELDSLKELLKGEGYSLDANTLFGLFSEDPYAYELPMPMESDLEPSGKASGSELMAYTSNMDLSDMLGGDDEWKLPASPEPTDDFDIDADLL